MSQYLITAGRGPAECQWVVYQAAHYLIGIISMKEYSAYLENEVAGDKPDTFKSCVLNTDISNSFMQEWCGSILWKGQSVYRPTHKRQNWYIALQPLKLTKTNIDTIDGYYFTTHKSSGPGGQHVNKTQSAVRIIHPDSGISMSVNDTRSQSMNKKIAIERLSEAIEKQKLKNLEDNKTSQFMQHFDLERGNPVQVFQGHHFKFLR